MTLALLLAAGCENKGPTPKEGSSAANPAPRVGSIETGGAHPGGAQDPHAGMGQPGDPHAGMAPPPNPHGDATGMGQPDESGRIDVGAIAFKVPAKWQAQPPSSSMRRAQLNASGSAGPAELIVYFFGAQGAGSAEENIQRWVGQFSSSDGSPVSDAKQSSSRVSDFGVTKVDVAGQYSGGMGAAGQPGPAKSDQRLIAAIVNTPQGPYYFKFLGPNASVAENAGAFDELIASISASK